MTLGYVRSLYAGKVSVPVASSIRSNTRALKLRIFNKCEMCGRDLLVEVGFFSLNRETDRFQLQCRNCNMVRNSFVS